MNKQLKAVSQVIELKKDRKYLFVFDLEKTGIRSADIDLMHKMLIKEGIKGMSIVVQNAEGLKVFEKET